MSRQYVINLENNEVGFIRNAYKSHMMPNGIRCDGYIFDCYFWDFYYQKYQYHEIYCEGEYLTIAEENFLEKYPRVIGPLTENGTWYSFQGRYIIPKDFHYNEQWKMLDPWREEQKQKRMITKPLF